MFTTRMLIRRWTAVLVAVLGGAASEGCLAQATELYAVESVKAAFLYRFLEYVEWPPGLSTDGPLTIAVLGDERLANELRRTVQGRKAHGREVRALSVTDAKEGVAADVLFVGAESKRKLGALPEAHERAPVLLVTDGAGALAHGAVINFLILDGNLRFEVSLPAAAQRGLKLSSRLLSVALRVERSGNQLEPSAADDPHWAWRASLR